MEILRQEDLSLPALDDDVATKNLGIPVVVVALSTAPLHHRPQNTPPPIAPQLLNAFRELHLRRLCLSYGASLAFLTAHEHENGLSRRCRRSQRERSPFSQEIARTRAITCFRRK
jgi:hypothetical protein